MSERPIIPKIEPLWAQRLPWLWGLLNAVIMGTLLAGVARFSIEVSAEATLFLGVSSGAAFGVFTAIFVARPRRQPRMAAKMQMLDIRSRESRWTFRLLPFLLIVYIAPRAIIGGVVDHRPWQIVWAFEFVAVALFSGLARYRRVVRIQEEYAKSQPPAVEPPHVPPPSRPGSPPPPPLPDRRAP